MAASASGVSSLDPDLSEEAALLRGGFSRVAGVDEVGRGAWAGPLVAAAVVLPTPDGVPPGFLAGVRDSKLLAPARREELAAQIVARARSVGIGSVDPPEIDALGLTAANELAMVRAVQALALEPDFLLVDAFTLRSAFLPQRGLIRGDRSSLSIAAASVVAKVHRDRCLAALAERHPGYGFERHKGYGVPAHRQALAALGPAPIHRLSYAPLRALVAGP